MNIGIHFFDMLLWLFGGVEHSAVHVRTPTRLAGYLELEWARVKWFLSIEVGDLPTGFLAAGKHAHRGLTFDGQDFDFSTGFDDLHREAVELAYRIRTAALEPAEPATEAWLRTGRPDLS